DAELTATTSEATEDRGRPTGGATDVIDELLAAGPAPSVLVPSGRTESLVGEVVDVKHPTLYGRVRVRWQDLEGQTFEKWLPTLQGLPVRVADRVLLMRAANWPEQVVTGVIDG